MSPLLKSCAKIVTKTFSTKIFSWGLLLALLGLPLTLGTTALAQEAKPKLAVLPMDYDGNQRGLAIALTNKLQEELLKRGKYTLLDRTHMEKVLGEQALQQKLCTTKDCAVAVGKTLGAQSLVTSKLTQVSEHLWQISASVVDVETGTLQSAASQTHEGSTSQLIDQKVPLLVDNLLGQKATPTATTTDSVEWQKTLNRLFPEDYPPFTGHALLFAGIGGFSTGLTANRQTTQVDESINGVGLELSGRLFMGSNFALNLAGQTGAIQGVNTSNHDTKNNNNNNNNGMHSNARGTYQVATLGLSYNFFWRQVVFNLGLGAQSSSARYTFNDAQLNNGTKGTWTYHTVTFPVLMGVEVRLENEMLVGLHMSIGMWGSASGSRVSAYEAQGYTVSAQPTMTGSLVFGAGF